MLETYQLLIVGVLIYFGFKWLQNWVQGGKCTSTARLDGKTVLITGANTGIGKACAEDFCRRGARVIILCRSEARAMEAINSIKKSVGPEKANIEFEQLDLSSLQNINQCVDRLNLKLSKVDILLNNAGVMACPEMRTAEGFEMQIGTNHFGHFYLTNLLLPLLRKAGKDSVARVVNVSSLAHTGGNIQWDDINFNKTKYSPGKAYNQSKLANVLFSNELADRERDNGIHTYSLHPGVVVSELGRHIPDVYGRFALIFLAYFVGPFTKTTENGAQTSIYCCVDESVEKDTGKYYSDCRAKTPAKQALDKDAQKKLWDLSVKLTNLK